MYYAAMQTAIDFGISNIDVVVRADGALRHWTRPANGTPTPELVAEVLSSGGLSFGDLRRIAVTGGQSRALPQRIGTCEIVSVGEIEAIGLGGRALVEAPESTPLLIVSAGSGKAMVVGRDTRVSGTMLEAAIVAGIFLDDVTEAVERESYPQDPPGKAVPLMRSIVLSLKFFSVVILGNLLALLLLLLPGVNLIAFFVVNAYLLSREFFEFAAMRFRNEADAKALRRRHAGTVFLAGFVIAAFVAIPLLNLLTPLFAAAMMVHLHKMISAREAAAAPHGR